MVIAAYLDEDISTLGSSHVPSIRHPSRSSIGYRYWKRGSSRNLSGGQREVAKGSRKTKKATGHQGKAETQQQGKTASQETGKSNQGGQESGKGSIPKPSQSPGKPAPLSPIAPLRAEVEITRGPADIHTVRGTTLHEDIVPHGERRRRVITHTEVAAAGGKRRVEQPANASSQPVSQHTVKTLAEGPVTEVTMRIPPGGRSHVAAEVPGRGRDSWDIPGAHGTSVITAESGLDEPAKLYASVTDGSFLETGAFPRNRGRY